VSFPAVQAISGLKLFHGGDYDVRAFLTWLRYVVLASSRLNIA